LKLYIPFQYDLLYMSDFNDGFQMNCLVKFIGAEEYYFRTWNSGRNVNSRVVCSTPNGICAVTKIYVFVF